MLGLFRKSNGQTSAGPPPPAGAPLGAPAAAAAADMAHLAVATDEPDRLDPDQTERDHVWTLLSGPGRRGVLAIEAAELGVWDADMQARTVTLDRRACRQLDSLLPPDRALSFDGPEFRGYLERIHPADRVIQGRAFAGLADGTLDQLRLVYRVRAGDGEWHTHLLRGITTERDAGGRPKRVVSTLRDLGRQSLQGAELSQSRRLNSRQDALLRALCAPPARVGLAVHDRESRFVSVNEFLAELYGVTPATLLGRSEPPAPPAEPARTIAPFVEHVLTTGEPMSGIELRFATPVRPDEPRDWLLSLQPMFDTAGEVVGVGEALLDITECKRADARLGLPAEAREVEDSLAALQRETARRAHALDRVVSETVGEVADILHSVGTEAGRLLSVRSDPEQVRGAARRILAATERGASIIARLRALARFGDSAPRAGATDDQPDPPPAPGLTPADDPDPATVLVVDPDELMRESLSLSLRGAGLPVTPAASGAAALAILGAHPRIGLLVTDWVMPDTDGVTLIKSARALKTDLPAILLTGEHGPDSKQTLDGAATGRFSLLHKPVKPDDLIDRVFDLLAGRVPPPEA